MFYNFYIPGDQKLSG